MGDQETIASPESGAGAAAPPTAPPAAPPTPVLRANPGPMPAAPDRFDAFISYSHTADADLAPALRRGLHQLAKPWYKTRAAKVFVDNASLSTNPALWTSITAALDGSRNFVLLCSPEAARSEWVDKEVAFWLAHKSAGSLLPVLTDGELVWDAATKDIDFARSTAAPPSLRGAFAEEPRHLDMRWTKDQSTAIALSLQNSQFKDAVADLAAPIHGVGKDDLVGEDIRQHHRTRALARAAVTALTLLLVVAVISATIARANAVRAERRRIDADAQRLSLESSALPGPPDLAFTLAAQAYRLRATNATAQALTNAADAAPQLVRLLHDHRAPITALDAQPDRHRIVSVDRDGVLLANDTVTGAVAARAKVTGRVFQLIAVPRGILVVSREGTSVVDAVTLRAVKDSTTPAASPLTAVAVVAGGVAVGDLGPGSDVRGELNWYGQDAAGKATAETVSSGIGTPLGIGVDGDAMIVLYSLPQDQKATVRRYVRENAGWKASWVANVSGTSTVLRADAENGLVAVGTTGGDVVLLDPTTGEQLDSISIGTSGVRTIAAATDFNLLLVGDATGTIHWVDPVSSSVAYLWKVHGGPVADVAPMPGSSYGSAGEDGTIALQRIRPLRQTAAATVDMGAKPFVIDAHPDRGFVYVGLEGGLATVDLTSRKVVTRTSLEGAVYAIAALPPASADDKARGGLADSPEPVAIGDTAGRIRVLQSGKVVETVSTGAQTVLQLTALPTRHEVVALDDSGALFALPVVAGRLGPKRALAADVGIAFAVSDDGQWLAYPRFDQTVVIIRMRDAKQMALVESSGAVQRLAFAADARSLAVGYDGSVAMWRLDLGAVPAKVVAGPVVALSAKPTAVAFAGPQLLVADTDSTVTLWDESTGESRGSIGAFDDSRAADLSHGLSTAYVAGGDLLVLRDLRIDSVVRSGCNVLGRSLNQRERARFGVDSTTSPCREGT